MANLTLSIDPDLLLEARKLALERNTSVNRMVREYLRSLVKEQGARRAARSRLRSKMGTGLYSLGSVTWTRDDLHER